MLHAPCSMLYALCLLHLFIELIVHGLDHFHHLSLPAEKLVCVGYYQNIWHSFWPDSKKQILCLNFSTLAQPKAQDGAGSSGDT